MRASLPTIICVCNALRVVGAMRADMVTLENWCGSVPATFQTPGWDTLTDKNIVCAYAMGSCYCSTKTTIGSRYWRGASYACTFNPTVPAGVMGHLALVPAKWLADRIFQLLASSGMTCPWAGLKYYGAPGYGKAAGWYHEPYQEDNVDYRTWSAHADDVATPWAGGQPTGNTLGCLSNAGLQSAPDGSRYWICQYRYNFSLPKPDTFYTVKSYVDHWPVVAARIADTTVRRHNIIVDCTRLCATDWTCMGFAVNKRTAHCVTAYEVTHSSAVEAKPGYVIYEKVFIL